MGVHKVMKVCSSPTCPNITAEGRCPDCRTRAEQKRGTARQRGYGTEHADTFRAAVLAKDPRCVVQGPRCTGKSTVADHHPRSRRALIQAGLDPNNPAHGRGLCASCHGTATAASPDQRGGWNRR